MIKVFIWSYRGKNDAWGHASMQVGHTYISWWPQHAGQVPSRISKILPQQLGENIYASHPIRNQTFANDVRGENNQMPDHTIHLQGLDEEAVHKWWAGFGLQYKGRYLHGPLQAWKTLERNCSTVVAAGLKAGGADQYASKWNSSNLVWTPAKVLAYAKDVQAGLTRRARL